MPPPRPKPEAKFHFQQNIRRGYKVARRIAPYISDAVGGYLTNGVTGAIMAPAQRGLRELLPDTFTNNREKRRRVRLLKDKPSKPLREALSGYRDQAAKDRVKEGYFKKPYKGLKDADSDESDYSVRSSGGSKLLVVC